MASKKSTRSNVLIMGAAGRDFHNFNMYYRGNRKFNVVAFTATQIPDIDGRKYPAKLAGGLYPRGIPIHAEDKLEELIKKLKVDEVVFSYSDVPHMYVMHMASRVIAAGADFHMMGTKRTLLKSKKPMVTICATRTGCGKSQTTRKVCEELIDMGYKVVAVRHPMPYGDLVKQKVQRFAKMSDLVKHKCTIEEREEYEPHIMRGVVIYAGVDYEAILRRAEKEADVIVWDGGNNDLPFFEGKVNFVVTDPHRAGHGLSYHPGEANLRAADVVVINKIDTAEKKGIKACEANIKAVNPKAKIIHAKSPVSVDNGKLIKGKRVLVIEDGPTLTHGEMKYGAGVVAAKKYKAKSMVDPRKYAVGTLKGTYKKYPDIGILLPAMGYGDKQTKDLEKTINATPCDVVIIATPIDLRRIVNIKKPSVRVTYELAEVGKPDIRSSLIAGGFKVKKKKKAKKK